MRSPYETANGPAIRDLRKKRDLTLEGTAALLAQQLGHPVDISTISKIETGSRDASDELVDALCVVLDGDRKQLVRITIPPELVQHVRALDDQAQAAS